MGYRFILLTIVSFMFLVVCFSCQSHREKQSIRIASYNVSMFRDSLGHLTQILSEAKDSQIAAVATVIQTTRPDILVLMEFDYDSTGRAIQLFQKNFLEISQAGKDTIQYKYTYQIPSNTGILSSRDLNRDGIIELPDDGFGFGKFEGQYASAVLSNFPLKIDQIRSFQYFLWKNMPNAKIPLLEDGNWYYPEETWRDFRLSSKNHVDIPVEMPGNNICHLLISHPTPPVFDGPEDRNGKRNHDEIRFWSDYISNADYLIDDAGQSGGLHENACFVILGDLNSDPLDGDSYKDAIRNLLNHPFVNQDVTTGKKIPFSNGGTQNNQRENDLGDPGYDTSFFGLRIDYVIPSKSLQVADSGVFWPAQDEPDHHLITNRRASDHLLVWIDVVSD